jgi:hypothetical protein
MEQDAPGPFDARLEEGARDRLASRFERPVRSLRATQSHEGRPGIPKHRPDVGEVEVDQTRGRDEVQDPLHGLTEHVIYGRERVEHRGVVGHDPGDAVVRDHDERVDVLAQQRGRIVSHLPPTRALEIERLGDHADRQGALLLGLRCDDRSGTRPGATTETGGHEDEVGPGDRSSDPLDVLLGRPSPDVRVSARSEPMGDGVADPDPRLSR